MGIFKKTLDDAEKVLGSDRNKFGAIIKKHIDEEHNIGSQMSLLLNDVAHYQRCLLVLSQGLHTEEWLRDKLEDAKKTLAEIKERMTVLLKELKDA